MADRPATPLLLVAVLAAGASRRLGRPKQLVELAGEPLLRRACRIALAADVGEVIAVLGCEAVACSAVIADVPVAIHVNAEWPEGLAASIRCATRAAIPQNAAGLMLLHCDQYRVTADGLRSLADAWKAAPDVAHLSRDDEYVGPPAIIPAGSFAALLTLAGDRGARAVVSDALSMVTVAGAKFDLDDKRQMIDAIGMHCSSPGTPGEAG